jgi:predicted phage terminase large subunit-like protein
VNAEATEKIKQKCQDSLLAFSVVTDRNFQPFWHHRVIADKLEQVERGELKRLIITLPPRSGKSYLTTQKFPVWYLGKHPEKEVIVAAYSAELAETFGFLSRDIALGEATKAVFNLNIRSDSQAKDHWMTDKGGGYRAVGAGGSVTGVGAHLIIMDDLIKNNEEAESQTTRDKLWTWYISTLYTRLYSGAAVILVTTRWHLDDIAGRLMAEEVNGGDHWEVINIPAIAETDESYPVGEKFIERKAGEVIEPKLFSKEEVLQKKNVLGSFYFSALYQGQPISSENQEFRKDNFKYIELDEVLKMTTRRFMTIDTAISKKASGDYTGITLNFVNRENKWHVMTWKLRVSPQELMEFIFKTWKQHNVEQIGIEKTIYLMAVKPYFDEEMRKRNQFPYVTELAHNQINKEVRIRALLPYYESGSVYHIKGRIDGLEEELLTFPKGRHDDVLDSLSYQTQVVKKPYEHGEKKVHVFKPTSFR